MRRTKERKDEMSNWNRKYYGIGLKFEPQIIRVENDEALRHFLMNEENAALRLATVIRKAYRLKYGIDLAISRDSLAVEIKGHYNIKRICCTIESGQIFMVPNHILQKFLDKMQMHMKVIDCGEMKCDNNRWVWDILAWVKLITRF